MAWRVIHEPAKINGCDHRYNHLSYYYFHAHDAHGFVLTDGHIVVPVSDMNIVSHEVHFNF